MTAMFWVMAVALADPPGERADGDAVPVAADAPATDAPPTEPVPVEAPLPADGRLVVDIEDVRPRRMPKVRFPSDPSLRTRGETPCRVLLLVDARGRVGSVEDIECPAPFLASVRDVSEKMRFKPVVRAGDAVPYATELIVRFRHSG